MIVKCKATKPDNEQRKQLGEYYNRFIVKHDSHLSVGKKYLVLGLVINSGSERMSLGLSVTVLCDYEHIESYPLVLFDILDATVDLEWELHTKADGIATIAPELMGRQHFAEDHADGVPEVRRAFAELFQRMMNRQSCNIGRLQ